MTFDAEWRVRFGEVDYAGVIYYPHIFHRVMFAVEDFFAEIGWELSESLDRSYGLPIVHAEVDLLNPIRIGDTVRIAVEPRLGTSSITFDLIGRRGDEPVFEAVQTQVIVDLEAFETRSVPAELADKLAPYCE